MTYDYSETVDYLLHWYDYNQRILPWRENPKPYYVWVSEIMLQQTRVEAVKGYFERFLEGLPDIQALAEAPEEKLLKLWEGLGYYNRVRNLQKAAKIVMEQYGGELPADYKELLKLPGIGSYTAGAISSIAFQLPEPAVDGNLLRVCKRISGSFDDITKEKVKKGLEEDLRAIMPKDRPGDYNQALMELGATVCIPNGVPLCEKCPVMHLCTAFKKGLTDQIPVKPSKKARKIEERTILVLECDNQYAIRKREEKGLLAGLWELPSLDGSYGIIKIQEYMKELGINVIEVEQLPKAKHIFSHIEWHMLGYRIRLDEMNSVKEKLDDTIMFASKQEIMDVYTLPTALVAYRNVIEAIK